MEQKAEMGRKEGLTIFASGEEGGKAICKAAVGGMGEGFAKVRGNMKGGNWSRQN